MMKQKKTILLVDDTDIVRDVLSGLLESAGYPVDLARNGMEALEKLEERRFDVVITDIKMPGMNGIELLREITSRFPETEVILITGYDTHAQEIFLTMGAKAFIHKSCEVETFIRRIFEAIERETEEICPQVKR